MAGVEMGQVKPELSASASELPPAEVRGVNRDEAQLARFGKKQQLKRNFRFVSVVALTCTVMITWEGFLTTFLIGLTNGGPTGVFTGYIFVWVGNILQVLVMAEMASMIPIAGGQYNWVSVLAPKSCSKFLSYLTGWMTFLAWQATLAAAAFLAGTMIQGLLELNYPTYAPQGWHGTLLFYAILLVAVITNTWLSRILPQVESLVLLVHILGYFAVLIPLVYLAPHSSSEEVFQQFMNNAGWPSDGLTWFIGLSGSMLAFVGIDAAGHISEEIQSASSVVPWSMIASVMINGALGFGMMVALLFCIGDIGELLSSTSQYPYIQVFANAAKSNGGGTAMVAVPTAMMSFAAIGALTTASRMTWAFARERALPFSQFLSKVEPRTSLPLHAIGLSTVISMLLALINIGSTAAFNALVSLVVSSAYACFGIAAGVMLYVRITVPEDEIPWGDFRLGFAGIPLTIASLIYTVIGIFFSFWPTLPNPALTLVNWSPLMFGFVVLFSIVYWAIWGRKVYTGPIREVVLEGDQAVFKSNRNSQFRSARNSQFY